MEWKIANILFADVKGYSALDDERMKVFHEKIFQQISGQISDLQIDFINTWGDGIVLVAVKISDICEAALKLRDMFKNMNWSRYGLTRLDIRISIHHGEYLEGIDKLTNRNTFCGSTVVTAARIEPVTPPGRIWMTEDAAVSLRSHIGKEKAAQREEYFAVDQIGVIELPKKYGQINISCLRRYDEAPISAAEIERVHEQARMRVSTSEHNQSISGTSSSFYIVVGIVVHEGKVILIRRNENREGLDWMFPSGKKWPTFDDFFTVEKEVREETGIVCEAQSVITILDQHPRTKFKCVYILLKPSEDLTVRNGDPFENSKVEWVEIPDAISRIGPALNPRVKEFLLDHVSMQTAP